MSSSNYRQRWSELKGEAHDPEMIGRLANQIAASFLDGFLMDGSYTEDHINLLCEMSTRHEGTQLSRPAARALFGIIIERLCDEFEELPTAFYNRVMAHVISFCRQLPAGKPLDRELTAAGIRTGEDMIERMARIRDRDSRLGIVNPPRHIFVLSRVTIGADVAVTSVILQRLARFFPESEQILIGPEKCRQIFGGRRGLTIAPVNYQRNGGIYERLDSWLQVRKIIFSCTSADVAGTALLVDPDSRLSQLGLLPLIPEERYFYFNSRSADTGKNRLSIGALTNRWLDRISGQSHFTYPGIWPAADTLGKASRFCRQLRDRGARRLIAVNFGVGGNPRKRIGRSFEQRLLQHLLDEPGTAILLDRGFGEAESGDTDRLMEDLSRQDQRVRSVGIDEPPSSMAAGGVIALRLGIGELAALIKNCDEYIGYDSAGQHMAAALGVPCTTIFAGSNSMRFVQRWAALGPGKRHIVHADTLTDPSSVDIDDVISRIAAARGTA